MRQLIAVLTLVAAAIVSEAWRIAANIAKLPILSWR